MKLSKIYLFVLFYATLLYIFNICTAAPKATSGPYRTILLHTEPCVKPSHPYEKVPTATFYAEVYNTTKKHNLMRGNATILRDNKNLMMRFKGFYMEKSKWQLSYYFNNVGCRGLMISVIVSMIGLKYDRKTCSAAKGTYSFENIDFNELDHNWAKEREYGRLKWVTEAYSRAGTVACWQTETIVGPL